jgi:predicted Zn-dependent protease
MDALSGHVDPTLRPRITRLSRYGIPEDGGEVGRDAYLDHIDGMVFGDDPRDGVLRGQAFTCARCNLAFDLPAGWKGDVEADGLGGRSPSGDQTMSFYHLGHPGIPEGVRVKLREKLASASIVKEMAAGLPVVIGRVEGKDPPEELAMIADGDETYTLMTAGDETRAALHRMLTTLRRPRPADMNVTPKRLRVRTVTEQGRFKDVLPRTCRSDSDPMQHALLNDVEFWGVVWEGTRLKCIEP